jgi:hypothetical protein
VITVSQPDNTGYEKGVDVSVVDGEISYRG